MRRSFLVVVLSLATFLPIRTQVTRGEENSQTCASLVQTALTLTEQYCEGTGRNQACYGNIRVDASPRLETDVFVFEEQGDIVPVADVQSLRTSPMDLGSGEWGVALMRLQAALIESNPANITLILMGDTTLEPVSTGSDAPAALEVSANTSYFRIPVRQSPSTRAPVITTLAPGDTVIATGRVATNRWLRVELPDGSGWGWVFTALLRSTRTFDTLQVIDVTAPPSGPMHAFYFTSGGDDSACREAPDSGMLIQTPEGVAEVTLLINEVDIQLGSTVYVQAGANEKLGIYVVEGHANVTVAGTVERVPAGAFTSVPLDAELRPSGPPEDAQPYETKSVEALPVPLLDRPVEISEPADDGDDLVGPGQSQANRPPLDDSVAQLSNRPLIGDGEDEETLTGTPTPGGLEADAMTPTGTPVDEGGFVLDDPGGALSPTPGPPDDPLQPTPDGGPWPPSPTPGAEGFLPTATPLDPDWPPYTPVWPPSSTPTAMRIPPGLQPLLFGNPARPRPLRPLERLCGEFPDCLTPTPTAKDVDSVLDPEAPLN